MSNHDSVYNPYTDGNSSRAGRLVTALMVVFAMLLAGYYAQRGYEDAQRDCELRAIHSADPNATASFSLTWSPPFTTCTIVGSDNQEA
ncbi:hypothetical protein [Timonella senegalensis]|uniref:hypothetical protein n=1 Tax=Timonella senegalensis TaxID=1465825 RepID=UPI0028AC00BC|nr:hypothetical protein [Timonella senegalensis]